MIKVFPYYCREIQTPMGREEILAALKANVEPRKFLRMTRKHLPFQGKVMREGFDITRIIHYQNSFLPRITGTWRYGSTGMIVTVTMTLDQVTWVFVGLWNGISLLALLSGLFWPTPKNTPSFITIFIPTGMLVLFWVFTLWGFWSEVRRVLPLLTNLFRGRLRNS